MTDPITVSFIGAIALIGQARNSDPSYGQGLQGYAKRYGTFYSDTGIGTLMTTSVFRRYFIRTRAIFSSAREAFGIALCIP